MVIFATPDFGASGAILLLLLIVWAIVFLFALIGISRGIKLLGSDSPKRRKNGFLLIAVSGLIPLLCCVGPSHVIRLVYGNYPLGAYPNNKIKKGMTRDEVEAILGTPHEQFKRDEEERWYYWLDSFGMGYFGVHFGPDGRVEGTHGN
jgi:hypothetical protein